MRGDRSIRIPRVVTAQSVALEHLRVSIGSGVLRPGDQIRQDAVASELSLSIVPVREALKVLQTEGQVRYEPNRGYFVSRLSHEELREAYHLRKLLEDDAVRLAVPKLTEEALNDLQQAIADMDEANALQDVPALSEANRRFHFRLYEAAEMPRMANFIRILWDTTEPYRSLFFNEHEHRIRVNEEHREIIAAARSRDVNKTVRLLNVHRDGTVRELAELLTRPAAETDSGNPG